MSKRRVFDIDFTPDTAAVPAGTAGCFLGSMARQFRTLNSIRRFLARFCTVLLGASGVVSP